MPARDVYHNTVKQALIKDGWTITNDPLHLKWGRKDMYYVATASSWKIGKSRSTSSKNTVNGVVS